MIASPPQTIWLDTGHKEKSGTGRNQKVTRLLDDVDLLTVIPGHVSTVAGRGLELQPAGPVATSLWRQTEDQWIYRCVLNEFPGTKLLVVAGTEKVAASVQVSPDGGVLALLPEPRIPDEVDELEDEDEDDPSDDLGASGQDVSAGKLSVPASMIAWARQMSLHDSEPVPEWAAEFKFESEILRQAKLARLEKSIAELAQKVDALKHEQAEDDRWKRLSFSSGAALEDQARRAFEVLGFTVLEGQRGRSDLRVQYDTERVVVEVKGLSKSAAERNAAQLEKWVAEEVAEGVRAKGVLVVNTWREAAPDQRDVDFPAQMIPYATARGHCLMTSLQLLTLARGTIAGKTAASDAARAVLSTIGLFEGDTLLLRRQTEALAR